MVLLLNGKSELGKKEKKAQVQKREGKKGIRYIDSTVVDMGIK